MFDIAQVPQEGTSLVDLEVHTQADPTPEDLFTLREMSHLNPEVRQVFLDAPSHPSGWLGEALKETVGAELAEAAEYLAAEYNQFRGRLILDPETGRAVALIHATDIIVEKVDGALAPLVYMRPEVEAEVTMALHNQAHDRQDLKFLAARRGATELGLLRASPQGRRKIATKLTQDIKLHELPGPTGSLFARLLVDRSTEGLREVPLTVYAQSRVKVLDQRTYNMGYDVHAANRAALGAGLAREVADVLAREVGAKTLLPFETADTSYMWAGSCPRQKPDNHIVAPNMGCLLRIGPNPGVLRDVSVIVQSRDFLGSWDLRAKLTGTLYLDLSQLDKVEFDPGPEVFAPTVVPRLR